MYTYNIRIDDAIVSRAKKVFGGEKAMQIWIEDVLNKALLSYTSQASKPKPIDSEEVYLQVKALENDPNGLLKLGSVLLPSPYSADELRQETPSFLQMQGILKGEGNEATDRQMLDEYLQEKYNV
jgi:hypothetical protein